MNFSQLIFPQQSRDFKAKRWIKIALRTGHLIGMAGMAAYVISDTFITNWLFFIHLTIASGVAMMMLDIRSNGVWLVQLRDQAIIKLILFSAMLMAEQHDSLLFFSMIIISGLIAHAPSNIRYYSIFHRRRIESLYAIDKQPTSAKKCYYD